MYGNSGNCKQISMAGEPKLRESRKLGRKGSLGQDCKSLKCHLDICLDAILKMNGET